MNELFIFRQLKATEKILDQLKAGIESVFGKINCDRSAISDMLGDNDTVNESNMMQYLGIIEQKTNELLQIHAYLQLKELENRPDGSPGTPPVNAAALLGGPTSPPIAAPIQIVPPSTEDDRDDEAGEFADDPVDFERPLTQGELKMKVLRSVARREQNMNTTMTSPSSKKVDKQSTEKTPRPADVGGKKRVSIK